MLELNDEDDEAIQQAERRRIEAKINKLDAFAKFSRILRDEFVEQLNRIGQEEKSQ